MKTNIYDPSNQNVKAFIQKQHHTTKEIIKINAKNISEYDIINIEGSNDITNWVEENTIETADHLIILKGTIADIINAKKYAHEKVGKPYEEDKDNLEFDYITEDEAMSMAEEDGEIDSITIFDDVIVFSFFSHYPVFHAVKDPTNEFIEEITLYVRGSYRDNRS